MGRLGRGSIDARVAGVERRGFRSQPHGFNPGEIDGLLAIPDEVRANAAPPLPENPVSRAGNLWLCGKHRVLCGDALRPEDVGQLLGDRKPILMVTDPPYGIQLDSEWRDRAGLNGCGPAEASYMKHRTAGHTETTISGDTRADWSEAFELVPSLQIGYVPIMRHMCNLETVKTHEGTDHIHALVIGERVTGVAAYR
jgi:hypothetical protein